MYLLCAGAYVASDFHIVRAYPGKMYTWGYFPETMHYDVDKLISEKVYGENKIHYLLWAARMIDCKHPELALETAKYLKEKGLTFHLDIIGGGELYPRMEALAKEYKLEECVKQLHSMVMNAHYAPNRCAEFIKEIREELKQFSKGAN